MTLAEFNAWMDEGINSPLQLVERAETITDCEDLKAAAQAFLAAADNFQTELGKVIP